MVSTTGTITTVAGIGTEGFSGDGGPATAAQLFGAADVAVDGTDLFIADGRNNRVRKVDTTSGIITTVAGTGTPGYNGDGIAATSAQLNVPFAVTVGAAGNLYIADAGNNRVRKVDTSGIITTVAGTGAPGYNGDGITATNANLYVPGDVDVDDAGNLYIADSGNGRVRRVDPSGTISTVAAAVFRSSRAVTAGQPPPPA